MCCLGGERHVESCAACCSWYGFCSKAGEDITQYSDNDHCARFVVPTHALI